MRFDAVAAGAVLCLLLGACAGPAGKPEEASPPARSTPDDAALHAALAYYQALPKGGTAPPARPQTPLQQVELAMLLGGPSNTDLPRAMGLLDTVLRSELPQALSLQPLARLLHDQYAARQRAEAAGDRANTAARDAQRRADALQDKLDALAEIERSLPARPARLAPHKESSR